MRDGLTLKTRLVGLLGMLVSVLAAAALPATITGCAGPRYEQVATGTPPGGRATIAVRWRRLLTQPPLLEYKPQEFASAASDGRRVFVGSSEGIFHAIDAQSGSDYWKATVAGGVSSHPLYLADSNTVLLGTDDGVLYAFDAATGKERWTYRSKGSINSTPVYEDGLVYFTNGENRLYALDAQSGAWRWQYERESPENFTIRGSGSPLLRGGRAYVGFSDGYLVALSAHTGDVVWSRSLAGEAQRFMDVDATPVMDGGLLYASSYSGGVYGIDPKSGGIRWRFPVEGAGTVAAHAGRVWFAAARNGVYCLDSEGRLVWRQSLSKQGELSAPLLVEGADGARLFVSASQGGMYVIEAKEGRLLQFFSPGHGITASPTTDGKELYVLTNSGFFYAFNLFPRR